MYRGKSTWTNNSQKNKINVIVQTPWRMIGQSSVRVSYGHRSRRRYCFGVFENNGLSLLSILDENNCEPPPQLDPKKTQTRRMSKLENKKVDLIVCSIKQMRTIAWKYFCDQKLNKRMTFQWSKMTSKWKDGHGWDLISWKWKERGQSMTCVPKTGSAGAKKSPPSNRS